MDLTKSIVYNGLTIASTSGTTGGTPWGGVAINAIDYTDADIDQYLDKRAIQDGIDAADVYYGARRIAIDASVFGTTRGDTFDRLEDFAYAFDPVIAYNADTANIGFLPFQFYQPTADISTWSTSAFPSGIPLQFYARPMTPAKWSVSRDNSGGVAGLGLSIRVSSVLLARDPRKYLQTSIQSDITTATQTATYRGNYQSWPVITFSMSAAGNSATIIAIAGGSVQINLATTTSGTYTLDYATRTIKNSSDVLVTGLFATSVTQDYRQVKSGSTFSVSHTTGFSSLTLTYREAFI